jgi:hypothetical protein
MQSLICVEPTHTTKQRITVMEELWKEWMVYSILNGTVRVPYKGIPELQLLKEYIFSPHNNQLMIKCPPRFPFLTILYLYYCSA